MLAASLPALDAEDVEDLEEAPDNEVEAAEEEILDQATAARSIAELRAEIQTLARLEALALAIRRSGEDKKWRELASLLAEIFTPAAIANQLAEDEGTVRGRSAARTEAEAITDARSWSCSPSIATRSTTWNRASPRCWAASRPWS